MPSTPFSSIRNGNFFHGEDRYVYSPSRKRHLKSVRGVGTCSLYYHGRKLLLFLNDLQVFPYLLKFLVSQCLILGFKLAHWWGKKMKLCLPLCPPLLSLPLASIFLHYSFFPPAPLLSSHTPLLPQTSVPPFSSPWPFPFSLSDFFPVLP